MKRRSSVLPTTRRPSCCSCSAMRRKLGRSGGKATVARPMSAIVTLHRCCRLILFIRASVSRTLERNTFQDGGPAHASRRRRVYSDRIERASRSTRAARRARGQRARNDLRQTLAALPTAFLGDTGPFPRRLQGICRSTTAPYSGLAGTTAAGCSDRARDIVRRELIDFSARIDSLSVGTEGAGR